MLDDTGARHEQGDPQIIEAIATQSLDKLVPGPYQISYRIGRPTGHPITGTLTFTVASAPPSTSSAQTAGQSVA